MAEITFIPFFFCVYFLSLPALSVFCLGVFSSSFRRRNNATGNWEMISKKSGKRRGATLFLREPQMTTAESDEWQWQFWRTEGERRRKKQASSRDMEEATEEEENRANHREREREERARERGSARKVG
jgi:hypothetical protein